VEDQAGFKMKYLHFVTQKVIHCIVLCEFLISATHDICPAYFKTVIVFSVEYNF